MKKLSIILIGLLMSSAGLVQAVSPEQKEDTIVVTFGKSQIIIALNSEADKKRLEKLDLNAIIADLKEQIRNSDGEVTSIQIQDEEGSIYVKSDQRTVEAGEGVTVIEMESNDQPFERKVKSKGTFIEIETKREKRQNRTYQSTNFEIGLNNLLSDGNFLQDGSNDFGVVPVLSPLNSRYVAINSILSTPLFGRRSPVSLEWGGGISWYNFRFENSFHRLQNDAGTTLFFAEDGLGSINPIRSKLGVTYLNASVVPVINLTKKRVKVYENDETGAKKRVTQSGTRFSVGAGVYAGYRIHSWSNFVYRSASDKERIKESNNFNINNFRYGVRGQIGIAGVDLFVNYDLNELFVANRGPQVNAFSFGIIF